MNISKLCKSYVLFAAFDLLNQSCPYITSQSLVPMQNARVYPVRITTFFFTLRACKPRTANISSQANSLYMQKTGLSILREMRLRERVGFRLAVRVVKLFLACYYLSHRNRGLRIEISTARLKSTSKNGVFCDLI